MMTVQARSSDREDAIRSFDGLMEFYKRHEAGVLGIAGLAFLILIWQVGGMLMSDITFISKPSLVVLSIIDQTQSGQLISDTLISMRELAPGFGLACAIGIPAGMAMGRYRMVEYILDPYLWFFYSAPVIVFYPILIIWFGLGTNTVIALTFMFAIFPIVANTMTGVQGVDPAMIRAARSFGANDLQIFALVILPASIPAIVAGLRLGIGRGLIGTIVGEFFGANGGLGFRIAIYGTEMRITDMFAPVVVVMVIGVALIQGLAWAEGRIASWRS